MTTALNLNRSGAHPASDPNTAIATTRDLVKKYGSGTTAVTALAGIDIEIGRGELTVLMGPYGAGKSMLMHCLAGLDTPTSGTIKIEGQAVHNLLQRQLTKLRCLKIRFIFQRFDLVPEVTV